MNAPTNNEALHSPCESILSNLCIIQNETLSKIDCSLGFPSFKTVLCNSSFKVWNNYNNYLNFVLKIWMIITIICVHNLSICEIKVEKNSGLNRIRICDLYNTAKFIYLNCRECSLSLSYLQNYPDGQIMNIHRSDSYRVYLSKENVMECLEMEKENQQVKVHSWV